jgi:integrase
MHAVSVAARPGMRRGEVAGLRGQDVDLEAGHLAVRHTITAIDDPIQGGMKLIHGEPKSGKGRRVDLDQDTVALIRSWKAQQAQDQLTTGGAWPAHGLVSPARTARSSTRTQPPPSSTGW